MNVADLLGLPPRRLTKLDVARRQLKMATRMFLRGDDPIPIHTLACAAQDVLRDLLRAKGVAQASAIKDSDFIRPERQREYRDFINRPRDFLKHADREPDGLLDFIPEYSPFVLQDAAHMYEKLTGRMLREGRAFMLWFMFEYPGLLKSGPFAEEIKYLRGTIGLTRSRKTFLELLDRNDFCPDSD